ncbi:hypothetical protein [Noviherbaspirillum sedimenti]|uniref:Uncharacterized protein n=1 Tax=Noviherbaspirillum sedimenti TaxID=2320865 RepID=A0A3A3G5T6_9BURK|nr:hypothetical protein [Noviherbaspirillum sedimenti]RJG03883.1 hypothetical protein D3878_21695 [Noviherbaspirillum sedimenti]
MRKIGHRQLDRPGGAVEKFLTGCQVNQAVVFLVCTHELALAAIACLEVDAKGVIGDEADVFLRPDME